MLDKQIEKLAVRASAIARLFALRTVPGVIALRGKNAQLWKRTAYFCKGPRAAALPLGTSRVAFRSYVPYQHCSKALTRGFLASGPEKRHPSQRHREQVQVVIYLRQTCRQQKIFGRDRSQKEKTSTDLILGCLIGEMYERGSAHYLLVNEIERVLHPKLLLLLLLLFLLFFFF